MCQSFDWDCECSCKAKVTDLDVSFVSDQQILWFEIPVNDSLRVTVINTPQQLVDHLLDHRLIHISLVFSHELLQIILDKFEDQVQLLLVRLEHDLFQTRR